MNARGGAPFLATMEWFGRQGIKDMPERGILTVTVPGALHGWPQAMERYGNLILAGLFEDAFAFGEQGFPVTELIAGEWKHAEETPRSYEESARTYLIDGKAPVPDRYSTIETLRRRIKRSLGRVSRLFTAVKSKRPLWPSLRRGRDCFP